VLNVLDRVASRLEEWRRQGSGPGATWTQRLVDAPHPGKLSVTALHDPLLADDPLAEAYWSTSPTSSAPTRCDWAEAGRDGREVLKSRPAFFDADGMRVEQRFATLSPTARACPTS
jgi:prolyl oligopeptidase